MSNKERSIKAVSAAILLPIVMAASGCATDEKQAPNRGTPVPAGQLTQAELREELDTFGEFFRGSITHAADDLDARIPGTRAKKMSLVMRTRLVQAFHAMSERDDPATAFVEIWALCVRLREYLENGAGRSLYVPEQQVVIDAAKNLEAEIERIGRLFLKEDALANTRNDVRKFAVSNPITGVFSNLKVYATEPEKGRPNRFVGVLSVPMAPFRAMEGVPETATAIHRLKDTGDRFSDVVEELPESARWQLSLLMYELEETEMAKSFLGSLNTFSQSSAKMATAADELPKRLREELSTVIEQIDEKQKGIGQTLSQAEKTSANFERTLDRAEQVASSLDRVAGGAKEAAWAWEATAKATSEALKEYADIRPPKEDTAQPAKIEDYRDTAHAVTEAASELRLLTGEIRELAQAQHLTDLTGHLTWRAIQLAAAVFILAVAYRMITARLRRPTSVPQARPKRK